MVQLNDSYVYPALQEEVKRMHANTFLLDVDLSYHVYDSAIILPARLGVNANRETAALGGVLTSLPDTEDAAEIANLYIDGTGINYHTGDGYFPDQIMELLDDVIYLGYLHNCYGHNITDCLKNIWYFQTDDCAQRLRNGAKIAFISMAPIKSWQKELFSYLNINLDSCIFVSQPTRFNSVLIPDGSFLRTEKGGRAYTKEIHSTVNHLIDSALNSLEGVRNYPEKVYFTRTGWTRQRDDWGEQLIEKQLRKLGFAIISPEKYSIAEQIAYCQHARVFCATDGSVGHNAIFVKSDCHVIMLRKGLYSNLFSAAIADMKQFPLTILDCSLSLINRKGLFAYAGPFFIYPNALFCQCFGLPRQLFPFRLFKKYLSYVWRYEDINERLLFEPAYRNLLMEEIQFAQAQIEDRLQRYIPFRSSAIGRRLFRFLRHRLIEALLR